MSVEKNKLYISEPIYVLHVVTHMNRGGLETTIMNYYRNIDRSKVQFDFLTHRPEGEKNDFDFEISELGGHIFHIPRLNPFSKTYLMALNSFFFTHKKYEIIHVHQDCMSSVVLKAAKRAGIPVRIAHSHSSNQDLNLKYIIKLIYKRKILKYATQLFACGETAGKWMFGNNCEFKLLPNAIDTSKFCFSESIRYKKRKEMGFNDEDILIGHVGRFSTVKNHKFLVEVIKKLCQKNNNIKAVFAGQGELFVEIMNYVKVNGLCNKVKFLGLRSDIPEIMQAIDIFLLPSLYEGLPVSVLEAQAAGLRCFVSDKVPIDCAVTDLVSQISLETPAEKWAEEILNSINYKRANMKSYIVDAGFDIIENATYLENFYLDQKSKKK